MMEEVIRNFPRQFAWEPKIENEGKLAHLEKYILAGMGGSHLQGDILNTIAPESNLFIHRDYGLPSLTKRDLSQHLFIASSYSGNTEETVSAFRDGIQRGLQVVAISTGGLLLELAESHRVPFIKIPDTGIQPRMALGFTFRALVKVVGRGDILESSEKLAFELRAEDFETQGKALGEMLYGRVPVIYASERNSALAYIWKIKLNEGAKIPAFCNVFPELNHNEMAGFDTHKNTISLSEKFSFIFLQDSQDHPRIAKRQEVLKKLYEARGLRVFVLPMQGRTALHKVFSSSLLADWVVLALALKYQVDAEQVPMVEEFKKRMAEEQ